jgi:hypothetical protein
MEHPFAYQLQHIRWARTLVFAEKWMTILCLMFLYIYDRTKLFFAVLCTVATMSLLKVMGEQRMLEESVGIPQSRALIC